MDNMNTTTDHTHTPKSSFYGQSTCKACGRHIRRVYTATCNKTGEVETFGTNCHYHATGIDTRILDQRYAREAWGNGRPKKDTRPFYGPEPVETVIVEALFNLEGELITSNLRDTRYGESFYKNDTGEWFSFSQAKNPETRIRNDAKKGQYVGEVEVVAYVYEGRKIASTDGSFNHTIVRVLDNGLKP